MPLFLSMIIIGIFTGMVTGLSGASGVAIVVPLVTLLLGFPMHEAIGTSLLVDVIASFGVALTYYREGNINLRAGLYVGLGSIAGAQLSAGLASKVAPAGLGIGFGVIGMLMGVMMFRPNPIENMQQQSRTSGSGKKQILLALILGFGVGIMTGLFGAGGGIMIFLVLLFVLRLPIRSAIGTSTLLMTITACSGALGYGLHDNINLTAGLIIGLSAVVGGVASALFANRVDERLLSRIVGLLFIILGATMIAVGALPGT